jgi:hypothetical protein
MSASIRLFPATATEDAGGTLGHGLLPFGNLHRMDVEILGDLLDGLDALERFERDAGFEFWFVSSSFCFHFCGSGWGFCPLPTITIIA